MIGFIGPGRMGTPMAAHLLAAGHPLLVHDAKADAAAALLARGAHWASSAGEVAQRARTIITIVPSSKEVELVVGAMLPHLGPEHLLIEMTSADPSSTRHLAKEVHARGARMIDADLERARPLLSLMGKNIFHVGSIGTGHAMKIVNNVLSAACLTATAEAIVVAMRAGRGASRRASRGWGPRRPRRANITIPARAVDMGISGPASRWRSWTRTYAAS